MICFISFLAISNIFYYICRNRKGSAGKGRDSVLILWSRKGRAEGNGRLFILVNCLSARDCPLVDRKEHWKTDCCVACDEEPGRAVRFL